MNNGILELVLNSLMLSERNDYLQDSEANKGNGYPRDKGDRIRE